MLISKSSFWLRDLINTPKLKLYLKERNQWNNKTFNDINWEAYHQSSNHCSHTKQFIIKLSNNILPTARQKHKYDKTISPQCPMCKEEPETQDHVIRCICKINKNWKIHFLKRLNTKLRQLHTHPKSIKIITYAMGQWIVHKEIRWNQELNKTNV